MARFVWMEDRLLARYCKSSVNTLVDHRSQPTPSMIGGTSAQVDGVSPTQARLSDELEGKQMNSYVFTRVPDDYYQ